MYIFRLTLVLPWMLYIISVKAQNRKVGRLQEVFAWKQLTYDINGYMVLQDRFTEEDLGGGRSKRSGYIHFNDDDGRDQLNDGPVWSSRPSTPSSVSSSTVNPNDEVGRFFVQYNNVPMGAERVGHRLFITVPRRRYGIPATLNYIDLNQRNGRSPPLSPYPDMRRSRSLISVYRTRADECGRLWMVDTGVIEIPNNLRSLQPPAIVVFDLMTDRVILRYQLKSSDLPATNTPTGLASITVVIKNGDCSDAFAYIPDLTTYGVIVYSLRQNDSWRHTHNYFHFNPTAGNLRIAGQSFQWNDGIFSIAVGSPDRDGCRPCYFHPMASNQEFVVSSCDLEQRETNQTAFTLVGERGTDSQSTMHSLHNPTGVIFFAQIGSNAVSCWRTDAPLNPRNVAILAQDTEKLSYPADLHIYGDEVWVIANTLPRFIYSTYDTDAYNFFIYRAKVEDLIAGTNCDRANPSFGQTSSYTREKYNKYSG